MFLFITITNEIVSVTKFPIVIGSRSPIGLVIGVRSRGYPFTGTLLDTHVIRLSITRASMASFAMFPIFYSATDVFVQKKFSEDIFHSEVFL